MSMAQGAKMSNWQGGIRANAFVAGGLLKRLAPRMLGRKLSGFVHICDWYHLRYRVFELLEMTWVYPTILKCTELCRLDIDLMEQVQHICSVGWGGPDRQPRSSSRPPTCRRREHVALSQWSSQRQPAH